MLRKEMTVNKKRVQRLWKKLGLTLKRRVKKRRRGPSSLALRASRRNQIWAYDFIHDECANGRKLKMLTIIDEYTREVLAIEVDHRLSAQRVIGVLERVMRKREAPEYIRSDNGPEFVAKKLQSWLKRRQAGTLYIQPGRPWQNAYAESFHGKFREECLNLETFLDVRDARRIVREWLKYYNNQRPHSSLKGQTPSGFGAQSAVELGGSAPKPPEFSACGPNMKQAEAQELPPACPAADAALGLLSSRALSSAPAQSSEHDVPRRQAHVRTL
jgi:putative transposase